jgi:hypothetical protein
MCAIWCNKRAKLQKRKQRAQPALVVGRWLQQVAENHSGESLVFFGSNQLFMGMDFRNLRSALHDRERYASIRLVSSN